MSDKIVERQKIKLNGVEYYLDSLDKDSQKILGDIRVIDTEMQRLQVQMSIAGVAKNSLLEKIQENSEKFDKVPIDEDEVEEKIDKKETMKDSKGAGRTEETENQRRDTSGDSWEDQ